MMDQPATMPDASGITPEAPFVQFTRSECRECGEIEPTWVLTGEPSAEHTWDSAHHDKKGHSTFYLWTVGRHTSHVFSFGGHA